MGKAGPEDERKKLGIETEIDQIMEEQRLRCWYVIP